MAQTGVATLFSANVRHWVQYSALAVVLLVASNARAQNVQAAARAYEEGQRAQLEGNYEQAARLFEVAFRASPAAAALRSAIRNHRAANNKARAATLSLIALRQYAADSGTRDLAQETLDEAQSTLGRLVVRCSEACAVLVDGRLATLEPAPQSELFVQPGSRTVRVDVENATTPPERSVEIAAGQVLDLGFEVTREPEPQPEPDPEPDPVVAEPEPEPILEAPAEQSGGAPPYVTYIGIAITAALGGVLIWSVADLFNLSDTYKATPTQALWEDGNSARNRTWALGAATGVAAIGTLLIATLATDWGSDTQATAWVSPEGGGLALRSSFRGLP